MLDVLCTSEIIQRDNVIIDMMIKYSNVHTIKVLESCLDRDNEFVFVNSIAM